MSINRRNFIGNSFACLASLPLIASGKVKPSNIRYDIAERAAELFINNLEFKCNITSLNSLELYTTGISYTEKLNLYFSIDGFGIKDSMEIPTNVNWLDSDSLNISPFKVMDLIINKLITDYNFRLDKDFFIPEKRIKGIKKTLASASNPSETFVSTIAIHKIFGMNLINNRMKNN